MSTSNDVGSLLERVARERTVRLTTRGRRSGQPRSVTIWFVVDGDDVGLGTLKEERNWVRNARRHSDVELAFATARLRGRLEEVSDPAQHARIRGLMARKYWPAWLASWFGLGQRFTFRVDRLEAIPS